MIDKEKIAETLKLLNKAAIMETTRGNYEQALTIFGQSQELEQQLGLRLQVGESLVNKANVYFLMEKYDLCLEALKQAGEIFQKEKNPRGIFKSQQLAGEVHFRNKEYDKSAQVYEKCLRISSGGRERAISCFQAAVSYLKLKNNYKAQDYLGKSIAEFTRLDDKTGLIDCLRQRALLFKSMGRKDLALNDLRKCLDLTDNQDLIGDINRQMANI
jgi:tetratricopeptide (TPR) repeat protein